MICLTMGILLSTINRLSNLACLKSTLRTSFDVQSYYRRCLILKRCWWDVAVRNRNDILEEFAQSIGFCMLLAILWNKVE